VTQITQTTALWYASRATGVVSLLLLSLVMIIGMLVNRQGRLPGLPAFAVTGLHRNLSLLAVTFLAVHIGTAVADPFVTIRLVSAVVPFTAGYRPLWLGLGTAAFDLILALIVTSLLRARLGRRVWQGVHWLGYAAWPVAFVHGIGAGDDLRGGLLALAAGCALAVAAALLWRVWHALRQVPRAGRAATVLAGDARPAADHPRPARRPLIKSGAR
jgi:predicted ferric reductase